jgi:hypothetical protein
MHEGLCRQHESGLQPVRASMQAMCSTPARQRPQEALQHLRPHAPLLLSLGQLQLLLQVSRQLLRCSCPLLRLPLRLLRRLQLLLMPARLALQLPLQRLSAAQRALHALFHASTHLQHSRGQLNRGPLTLAPPPGLRLTDQHRVH